MPPAVRRPPRADARGPDHEPFSRRKGRCLLRHVSSGRARSVAPPAAPGAAPPGEPADEPRCRRPRRPHAGGRSSNASSSTGLRGAGVAGSHVRIGPGPARHV